MFSHHLSSYHLSVTWLKLKHPKYLIPYLILSGRIIREVRVSEGFLKGKVLGTAGLSMWTATLWTSREASNAFHLQGVHWKSVRTIGKWSSEAASGHKNINSRQLPQWEHIAALLKQTGNPYTFEPYSSTKPVAELISIPKIPIFAMCFSRVRA
ncbi:MAG: hypothetical protein F6K41_07170 [Symploca sp. SIO3E6]|nr:hypothetical protein [Caldora sp. SIO3E6]